MKRVKTLEELDTLYPKRPSEAATRKVSDRLIPSYRRWIEAAPFCILSTVGPKGTDASPRGEDGPVVRVLDEVTLALPDWKGNNRLDSLKNIVTDGRVSLMFLVPGSPNVIRVNGRAILTDDDTLRTSFARDDKAPRSVIVVKLETVFFQCARAIIRSDIWSGADAPNDLPSAGDFLHDVSHGEIDGSSYDMEWPAKAKEDLW